MALYQKGVEMKMPLKRLSEIIVMVTFLICIVLLFLYGIKFDALGFQRATLFDRVVIFIIGINFQLCIYYILFRFLFWVFKKVKNLIILKKNNSLSK